MNKIVCCVIMGTTLKSEPVGEGLAICMVDALKNKGVEVYSKDAPAETEAEKK